MKIITNILDLIMRRVFVIANGRAKMFNKIDYVMFPASGMAYFSQKIAEDFGEDYLFELGYNAGIDGANEMNEKLGVFRTPVPVSLSIIQKMFQTLGFGYMDIKSYSAKDNIGFMHLTDHPVIDFGKKEFGKKSKVCALYRGIFSAHSDKDLRIDGCKLKETLCVRNNDPYCEWSYNYFTDKKKKQNKS